MTTPSPGSRSSCASRIKACVVLATTAMSLSEALRNGPFTWFDGATALLVATQANQVDAARVLIEAGADVNARDGIHQRTSLHNLSRAAGQ